MGKIIDGILSIAFSLCIAFGGTNALREVYLWSRQAAFSKIIKGMGSLEHSTRKMTGGHLDF